MNQGAGIPYAHGSRVLKHQKVVPVFETSDMMMSEIARGTNYPSACHGPGFTPGVRPQGWYGDCMIPLAGGSSTIMSASILTSIWEQRQSNKEPSCRILAVSNDWCDNAGHFREYP